MKIEFMESFVQDLEKQARNRRVCRKVREIIQSVSLAEDLLELPDTKKLHPDGDYYRIRAENCQIGLLIEDGNAVFIRILSRKDIFHSFS